MVLLNAIYTTILWLVVSAVLAIFGEQQPTILQFLGCWALTFTGFMVYDLIQLWLEDFFEEDEDDPPARA